jgi:hypothetical protein
MMYLVCQHVPRPPLSRNALSVGVYTGMRALLQNMEGLVGAMQPAVAVNFVHAGHPRSVTLA